MQKKITYAEFIEKTWDPDITEDDLRPYLKVVPGKGGLDFEVRIDPTKVEMSPLDVEHESAMQIGNGLARLLRVRKFRINRKKHPARPIIVSEGDSWFQFPFLIKEVIDHLYDHYTIWSMGAAGDTLQNIIYGGSGHYKFELMQGLRRHKKDVQAFLFSAAGNDFLGEDPETGESMIEGLLKNFNNDASDIIGHINHQTLAKRIAMLKTGYLGMVEMIRMEPGLESLPVIIHGYDYVFPWPANPEDRRNPLHAKKDQWLGRAFAAKNLTDSAMNRKIIVYLIDQLYQMLSEIADTDLKGRVYVVDCRGAMPNVEDWIDEIHGTSDGFIKVAARFRATISDAIEPMVT